VPQYFPGLLPTSHREFPPVARAPAGVYSGRPYGPALVNLSKSDLPTKGLGEGQTLE
jgi:hypothetical protein